MLDSYFLFSPPSEILLRQTLGKLEQGFVIASDDLQVKFKDELGKGCFGRVYGGVLKLPSGEEQLVAVKTLSKEATYSDVSLFLEEAAVMQ